MRMVVDAELIHNWTARYADVTTGQLGELPDEIRAALLQAHNTHNKNGEDAQELANKVAAQFPNSLMKGDGDDEQGT